MFEFSRELKRLFTTDGPRDGLTGGQAPLLELLDLGLLRAEAKSADIAAGRISAKDPAQRTLDAARVWKELARRTGDPVALRKAASQAERAVDGFERENRIRGWAQARLEQALIALTGAELFGDEGLVAAAGFALRDVREKAAGSAAATLALARQIGIANHRVLTGGDLGEVLAAARAFDGPVAALEAQLRNRSVSKTAVLDLRCERAELLLAAGSRLRDPEVLALACTELTAVLARLDATYEPISFARAKELHCAALAALGEARGEIDTVADAVTAMADTLDAVGAHHSPLDWARLQHSLAVALRALGEASDCETAFDQALSCFDRALWVLKADSGLILREAVASNRAAAMARRAELVGDPDSMAQAVDALKADLATLSPERDPVVWAVAQVNLARLYEARAQVLGHSDAEAAAAALALDAAMEVFVEHGLRSLADEASRALESLADRNRSEA